MYASSYNRNMNDRILLSGSKLSIPENYSGNAFGRGLTFNDTDSEEEKNAERAESVKNYSSRSAKKAVAEPQEESTAPRFYDIPNEISLKDIQKSKKRVQDLEEAENFTEALSQGYTAPYSDSPYTCRADECAELCNGHSDPQDMKPCAENDGHSDKIGSENSLTEGKEVLFSADKGVLGRIFSLGRSFMSGLFKRDDEGGSTLEDILIIALIILIAQKEDSMDTILLLALLLFIG